MGRRLRRHIPLFIYRARPDLVIEEHSPLLAAAPEALTYPDEMVEDFLNAAQELDYRRSAAELVADLRQRRITFPLHLSYDLYRLGRHLLHRWQEPDLREAFLRDVMYMDLGAKPKKRIMDADALRHWATQQGVPAVRSMLRHCAMVQHMLPDLEAALTPELKARCDALMLFGRVQLHWYLTHPEPARRQTAWEQRKLTRHLRLREVQLHAMGRSLHHLRRERTALLTRLRELSRVESPELDRLLAESTRIKAEREASERRHADALAAQAADYQAQIAAGKAALEQMRQQYGQARSLRAAWIRTGRG